MGDDRLTQTKTDITLTQEIPEAKLKTVWPALVGQFGAFKSVDGRREGQMRDRQAVELILAFEKKPSSNA